MIHVLGQTILSDDEAREIVDLHERAKSIMAFSQQAMLGYQKVCDALTEALMNVECMCDGEEEACTRCQGAANVQSVIEEHFPGDGDPTA